MRVGSLFSGIGGIDVGLERVGMQIVWQVEIGEYERQVSKRGSQGPEGTATFDPFTELWPTPQAYSHDPDSNPPGITKLDSAARGREALWASLREGGLGGASLMRE